MYHCDTKRPKQKYSSYLQPTSEIVLFFNSMYELKDMIKALKGVVKVILKLWKGLQEHTNEYIYLGQRTTSASFCKGVVLPETKE